MIGTKIGCITVGTGVRSVQIGISKYALANGAAWITARECRELIQILESAVIKAEAAGPPEPSALVTDEELDPFS